MEFILEVNLFMDDTLFISMNKTKQHFTRMHVITFL